MSQKSILVIDDDPTIQAFVKAGLEENGYNCIEAQSGEAGLEFLKEEQADCILLDWVMPNMDGMSVLKELKANDTTKDIPVVMLTGKTEISNVSESLTLGASDYIVKPFDTHNLISRLNKVFG